jgi:hypothetical protein
MTNEFQLVAVKRGWCPEWLWRQKPILFLALIYPFRWILTKKEQEAVNGSD